MKKLQTLISLCTVCLFSSSFLSAQIVVSTITDPFNGSGGLTMTTDGVLYIANFGQGLDNSNGTEVWKLDYLNGENLALFANGLNGASGNDFNSEGILFQSNIRGNQVSKIDKNGAVSFFSNSGVSCNVGINIDASDNIYVCNCCGTFKNTIRKITPTGQSTLFSSSGHFNCPNGITRDNNNNLYVSNFSNGNIVKVNEQGVASVLAATPGIPGVSSASNGHIIYSEKENVLYVASHGSHKIYKLTLDGQLSVLAGTGQRGNKDGAAMEATFSRPNGLALSISEDTLFVNSSIPVTDVGGRPLNPSVVRMISGLRNLSSTNQTTQINPFDVLYNEEKKEITLNGIVGDNLKVRISSISGQVLLEEMVSEQERTISIDKIKNTIPSILVVQVIDANGGLLTKKLFIQ